MTCYSENTLYKQSRPMYIISTRIYYLHVFLWSAYLACVRLSMFYYVGRRVALCSVSYMCATSKLCQMISFQRKCILHRKYFSYLNKSITIVLTILSNINGTQFHLACIIIGRFGFFGYVIY